MFSKYVYLLTGWCFICLGFSCTSSRPGLFGKKTPHETYLASLKDAGLVNTSMGKLWQSAANKSLVQPVDINIPFKETGYFEMEKPGAEGYLFAAKRGEKLLVQVNTRPVSSFLLFAELWEKVPGQAPRFIMAADTIFNKIEYDITKDGQYLIRLQPELLQGAAYTITVTTSPSLAFPINKTDNPRVISLWGVGRDAGARKHEGIDIQAKKRTPVIAPADGYVTSAGENNLGGKVVFFRPTGKDFTLYYAHLDTQWVNAGQRVNVGDTLGLTGNTGNARNTVSHLHFGIYTSVGAVDPFPFVNASRATVKEVRVDTSWLAKYVNVKNNTSLRYHETDQSSQQKIILAGGSIAKVKAASGDLYRIELPDGQQGFIRNVDASTQPLRRQSFPVVSYLLDRPDSNAAVKTVIEARKDLSVLGTYKNYYFGQWQDKYGWVRK